MTNNQPHVDASVGDLGEQGILEAMLPLLDSKQASLGPGDDAGALLVRGNEVLVSVDTLVENQDFRLIWPSGLEHSAYDIGWKSIAQNVSDINAMGGYATGAVISLSLPKSTSLEWVKDFSRGVAEAVKQLGAEKLTILGGDLGRSQEISVTTTVLGECEHGKILRSGVQTGDRLAVAGRVGAAGAGLSILEREGQEQRWSRAVSRIVEAQCRPVPPLESGPRAAQAGATAMMDLSDGLIRDSGRMAKASHVNFELESEALKDYALRLEAAADLTGTDPMSWVMFGGEDFGLLAAFPEDSEIPEEFTVIGVAKPTTGRRAIVKVDGKVVKPETGFDHFG